MASKSSVTVLVWIVAIALRMSSLGRGRLLPATVTLWTLHQCWGALAPQVTWVSTYRKRSYSAVRNWVWHEDGHRVAAGPVAVGFALLKLPVGDGLGATGLLVTWMKRWSVGLNGSRKGVGKTTHWPLRLND